MDFKEVGMYIIGVFGLVDLPFSHILPLLDLLIVSLVRRRYQSGKLSVRLLMKLIESTPLKYYLLMKDMVVDLVLFKTI